MTIRKRLSFGITVLLVLFLALGFVAYFHIGRIDDNLTRIIQDREQGKLSTALYHQHKNLEKDIINNKNSQEALYAVIARSFDNINEIIDKKAETKNEKVLEFLKMKTSIAEIATWLGTYHGIPKEEYKNRILKATETFKQELDKFNNLARTEEEKNFVTELGNSFKQTITVIKDILLLNEELRKNTTTLGEIAAQIDEFLDEEFEIFTRADLERTKEASHEIVGTVMVIAFILILTGFLDVFVFGAAITRSVAKPIVKLRDSFAEIVEGDFDAKIEIESSDEIGQLAASSKKIAEVLKNANISINNLEKEIAEHKIVEEELKKLNASLESANYELENTNKELKEFAYVAAHDLKTPLRAIGVLANWISTDYADKFDEKGQEHIKLLVGRAERMSNLIDNLLEYSKTGQSSHKKQVNLNNVLSEVISEIKTPENVDISIENHMPTILCDKTRMTRVFENLLKNAVQFANKPEAQIKIASVQENGSWKFSVTDNGPGIDRKYHEKIFKICQKLSPHDDTGGTGIGLSIVKKIVENDGGKIWLESEVGKGSTFYFTLPNLPSQNN